MTTPPARPRTSRAALTAVLDGNRRFVEGRPAHPNQDYRRRADSARRQDPFAVVVGCSDSRVAAEIIFDCGIGDLFVVRTAGHMLDVGALASIEFAVDTLHVPLVLILGHDNCGAVKATIDALDTGRLPSGFQRSIVEHVLPDVLQARAAGVLTEDAISRARAAATVDYLLHRSTIVAAAVDARRCAVAAASYDLAHGQIHLTRATPSLLTHGDPVRPATPQQ